MLSEVKDYGNSTIPLHLQVKATHNDALVQSVRDLVNGKNRRSNKFKRSIDVSKPRDLTADIPKKFSVGYWRRWYDDLTLLEDISLKEDEKQMSLNSTPAMRKKCLADKATKHQRNVVPPLVPVKGGGGTSISDYDRKAIMKFIGVSEKYEKQKVMKRVVLPPRHRDDDEGRVGIEVKKRTEAIPEASNLCNIKEVEEGDSSDDDDDDDDYDDDDDDDGDEGDNGLAGTNDVDIGAVGVGVTSSVSAMRGDGDDDDDDDAAVESLLDMSTSYISSAPASTFGSIITNTLSIDSALGDGLYSEGSYLKSKDLQQQQQQQELPHHENHSAVNCSEEDDNNNNDDSNDDGNDYSDRMEGMCGQFNEPLKLNSTFSSIRSKTLQNLESHTLGSLAGFGFGCNRNEHVLYGMCLDRSCCRRALWEQTALTLKDLGRVRGKRSTTLKPSKVVDMAMALVDSPHDYISPLHVAVANCDIVSIKHLCHVKEKVNDIVKPYDLCQTLLHMTVIKRNLRVTETLIECFRSYIHLDPMDKAGDTPLHIAASNGDYNIVMFLCDSGANPLVRNKANKYPIDLAKSHAIYQILKVEGDRRVLRDELHSIQLKLNSNSSGSNMNILLQPASSSSSLSASLSSEATSDASKSLKQVAYVFKTDKFKRTRKRVGATLSTAKKKLDDPSYNSFMIGYWKEDKQQQN